MLLKDNNPWVGLASYKSQDAARFFGREKESQSLAELIQANYCTILYGQSGAGKTSLIQAGICPILSGAHYLPIPIKLEHAGTISYARQIMERVEEEIRCIGGEIEFPVDIPQEMDDQSRAWLFFHTATFWDGQNYRITPSFFIDQFEELFTLTSDPYSVQGFFNLTDRLLQMIPPENISDAFEQKNIRLPYHEKPAFRLILSIREDFLARLEDYSYSIPALRRNRVGLAPMNGQQALEAIMSPIPGLVERDAALRILSKVTDKEVHDDAYYLEKMTVDSCILSLFCTEIYNQAAESGRDSITQDIIDQFGNDIIQTFYERNMDGISSVSARYLESHLLTTNGFRNMVALEDLVPEHVKLEELRQLEENRIIRIETLNGTQRVEFTHDVLCKVATNHRKTSNAKSERRKEVIHKTLYWFEALLNVTMVAGFFYDNSLNQMDVLRNSWRAVLFLVVFLFAFLLRLEHHGKRFKSPLVMTGVAIFGWIPLVLYVDNGYEDFLIIATFVYALTGTIYFFIDLARHQRSRNISFIKDSFCLTKDRPRWAAVLAFLLVSYGIVCMFAHQEVNGTLSLLLLMTIVPLLLETIDFLLPEWTEMRMRWRFGLLAEAGILVMIASQYTHTKVWYYLALLALAACTMAFAIRLRKLKIGWRILAGFAAFALFFYFAPNYILGYKPASLGEMARSPHGTIRVDAFPNMMKVSDKEGRQGVYSPSLKELVLPLVYDDIRSYPVVQTKSVPSAFGKSADEIMDMTFFLKKEGDDQWKESRLSKEYQLGRGFSGKLRNQMEDRYSAYMKMAESSLEQFATRDTSSFSDGNSSEASVDSRTLEYYREWSVYPDYYNPDIHLFLANSSRPSVSDGQVAKTIVYSCAINVTRQFLRDGGWRNDKENTLETLMYIVYYIYTHKISDSYVEKFNKYLTSEEAVSYLSTIDTLLLHGTERAMEAVLTSSDLQNSAFAELYWNDKNWYALLSLRTPEVKGFLSSYMENSSDNVSNAYFSIFTGDFAQSEAYSRQAIAERKTSPAKAMAVSNLIPALFFQGKVDECKEWLDQFAYVRTPTDIIALDALYQDLRLFCQNDVFQKETPEYDRYLGLLQSYHEDIFPGLKAFNWGYIDENPIVALYYKGEEIIHSVHFSLEDALFFDPEGTVVSCDAIMVYGYKKDPYIMLVQEGKKGFINNKGRLIYPVQADHAWMFSEGRAFVEEGNRLHVIDTLGRPAFERSFVDPRDYDSPGFIGIDFVYHDGLAPMIDENGRMGLIDMLGNWVIRPEYDYITNPDDYGRRRFLKNGEESTLP